MVSFAQVSPPKPRMHLPTPPPNELYVVISYKTSVLPLGKENRLRRKVQIKKFGNCTDHYWWEMQLILKFLPLSFEYFAASCVTFV
jgi:hypothetical protein